MFGATHRRSTYNVHMNPHIRAVHQLTHQRSTLNVCIFNVFNIQRFQHLILPNLAAPRRRCRCKNLRELTVGTESVLVLILFKRGSRKYTPCFKTTQCYCRAHVWQNSQGASKTKSRFTGCNFDCASQHIAGSERAAKDC